MTYVYAIGMYLHTSIGPHNAYDNIWLMPWHPANMFRQTFVTTLRLWSLIFRYISRTHTCYTHTTTKISVDINLIIISKTNRFVINSKKYWKPQNKTAKNRSRHTIFQSNRVDSCRMRKRISHWMEHLWIDILPNLVKLHKFSGYAAFIWQSANLWFNFCCLGCLSIGRPSMSWPWLFPLGGIFLCNIFGPIKCGLWCGNISNYMACWNYQGKLPLYQHISSYALAKVNTFFRSKKHCRQAVMLQLT